MEQLSLADVSEQMADMDFAMLSTHTEGGEIAARPMSNNGDVEFRGDSYYFTLESTRTVSDIERNPKVGLSFQGGKGLLGKKPFMISVEGNAELIRDKARFAEHWNSDLDRWFEDGIDTPGVVMIKVRATRITCWDGNQEREIKL